VSGKDAEHGGSGGRRPCRGGSTRRGTGLMLAALCATPALASPAWAQSPEAVASGAVTLSGTVRGRFDDRVRTLPGAFIEVRSPHRRFSTETDASGRYTLEGLPPGRLALRATHPGHRPVEVTVHGVGGRTLDVDLELTATPLRVDGVEVRAGAGAPSAANEDPDAPGDPVLEAADPELEVRLLEISPSLGETGIADAVQALPGNDPADPTDVLFMRGSSTDLKLVLLDGIPVYTPFHVAGLLRSFEPAVLEGADLHVGGAPARYDGGLSHILDLRTRSPRRDRVRATGSVDLLSASVATELPLGSRAGLLLSGRTLHDLGRAPLGGERPYGYGDLLMRGDADLASDHRLKATGFWNGESVRLDFGAGDSDARWSNRAGAVAYEGRWGDADLRVTAGGSRYDARLPLQPSATPDEPEPSAMLASAVSDRGRIEAELRWDGQAAVWRTGGSVEHIQAAFQAESLDGAEKSRSGGRTVAGGAFVETVRTLRPEVALRMGLRADAYSGTAPRLSPRVAVFWELGPEAILSVAAGRYHQVTRSPDARVDETLEAFANDATTPDELLPVATADHVLLSLDQRLGSSVSLGLQGFWKRFDGLVGADESVRNSGVDVRVRSTGERLAVWLGYGLSWFWSPVDLSGGATEFAGRHLLSSGVGGELFGPFRGEARVAYGAGLPSTSIPFGSQADYAAAPGPGTETLLGEGAGSESRASELPNPLDESFLRLDLEIHALFEPEWGDRSWRIRPYLRLLNALNRRDALFYAYQPWRPDSVTPLAERPILPILGLSFAF